MKVKSRRVAILVPGPVSLFELGCAVELFVLPRPELENWYQAEVLALPGHSLEGLAGLSLQAPSWKSLADFDDVLIPYWPIEQSAESNLITELQALYQRGGRLWSFCSGVFLLAQTGLLDGKDVSTHWRYRSKLIKAFPLLSYREDCLYRYQDRIACSAGSAAALDLGLEIIRRDYGHEVASVVARRLVSSPMRQGGQAQFVDRPVSRHPDLLAASLDWAIEHLAEPIAVDQLAERCNMSRRSYDRKFRQSMGQSPKSWLLSQRLQQAKNLLESSHISIEPLAQATGFANGSSLRHHFRGQFGLSPSEYRRQFQAK
ncbi:helix-turn-helix domain-containing protein [Pseudoteredinibacter isoporae]|nr:helix-turn-helix domain-containing protein [Pseudoteredinibacter isoporae]NIB25435.1 helix-turn-helix domain-containing protein [Pseudoteredinibacter isoporae]